MAQPTLVRRYIAQSATSNSTSWTPSWTRQVATTINSGDRVLWVCIVSADGGPTLSESGGNGWTLRDQTSQGSVVQAIWTKETTTAFNTTSEPAFVLGSTASEQYSGVIMGYQVASGKSVGWLLSSGATGSSANADPPSLSNSSGATQDITWIATLSLDSNTAVGVAPSGYGNNVGSAGAGAGHAGINVGDKQSNGVTNGSSENPGTFSNSSDQWVCYTAGVYEFSAADNISPDLYTNTQTFYQPTVTPGAVGLTPSLFTNTNSFNTHNITLYLVPDLFTDDDTFFTPTVTQGAANLSPDLYTNTNTFYSATVTPGAVNLTPNLFTNSNTFQLFGSELVTNGDGSSTTGWTTIYGNATIEATGGRLRITRSGAQGNGYYQTVSTTQGLTYRLQALMFPHEGTRARVALVQNGTPVEYFYYDIDGGTVDHIFVASALDQIYLEAADSTAWVSDGEYAEFDDISVKEQALRVTNSNSVAPSLFTNDQTFYQPTVTPGAVNLTPSLFTNTNTFYSPTVSLAGGTQNITVPLITNQNYFRHASGSNLISNGDFASDITGWNPRTSAGSNPTLSWESGKLRLTIVQADAYQEAYQDHGFANNGRYVIDVDYTNPSGVEVLVGEPGDTNSFTYSRSYSGSLNNIHFESHVGNNVSLATTPNTGTAGQYVEFDNVVVREATGHSIAIINDLRPLLVTNTNTFYDPTALSTYALTPALFSNDNTFYSPSLLPVSELTPALFTNDNTFYSATVTAGTVTLTPSLYTNTNTFFGPTVTTTVTLSAELFTNTNTFYSPTAENDNTVVPPLYANTNTFYSPTLALVGSSVQPQLMINTNYFFVPTVFDPFRDRPGRGLGHPMIPKGSRIRARFGRR